MCDEFCSCQWSCQIEPHIKWAIPQKGKTTTRVVHLRAAKTKICEDNIRAQLKRRCNARHLRKVATVHEHSHAWARGRDPLRGILQIAFIKIAKQNGTLTLQLFRKRLAVPAPACGAVDDGVSGLWRERSDNFVQQHGNVFKL
jgi:hypothetical protein